MKTTRGFTLLEMVLVIATIVLISGMLIPQVSSIISDGKISRVQTTFNVVKEAIIRYYKDTNEWPPNTYQGEADARTLNNYLRTNPGVTGWNGSYIDRPMGQDPWGTNYIYHNGALGNANWWTTIQCYGPNRADETDPAIISDDTRGDDINVWITGPGQKGVNK